MIDLRYHIVSIMAVFLALGLGILLGSSVVSSPLEARNIDALNRAREDRGQAERKAADVTKENADLKRTLAREIGPWAVNGRLDGQTYVLVVDDAEVPSWREHVVDKLADAGAQQKGTILLNKKWALDAPEDEGELVAAVRSEVGDFDPKEDPAGEAFALLGERFFDSSGRALIDELARAGFLSVQGRPDEDWPAIGSAVVVLSPVRAASEEPAVEPTPGLRSFVRRVAEGTPVLVASDQPVATSVVSQLRDGGGLPDTLSTFDSAPSEMDPSGVGVVAALLAAIEGRGGHFGAERGRTFVAPPGAAA